MIIRLSKILTVCAIALFASLVVMGNTTDYTTNFQFVHHVFLMDTLRGGESIRWRAIPEVWLHHAAYMIIIALETATAIMCWVGSIALWRLRQAPAREFNQGKRYAIIGLTCGFLTWQVAFMSIGGEWFGMWMSTRWNGVPDAFRFFTTIMLALIYLVQRDGKLTD